MCIRQKQNISSRSFLRIPSTLWDTFWICMVSDHTWMLPDVWRLGLHVGDQDIQVVRGRQGSDHLRRLKRNHEGTHLQVDTNQEVKYIFENSLCESSARKRKESLTKTPTPKKCNRNVQKLNLPSSSYERHHMPTRPACTLTTWHHYSGMFAMKTAKDDDENFPERSW